MPLLKLANTIILFQPPNFAQGDAPPGSLMVTNQTDRNSQRRFSMHWLLPDSLTRYRAWACSVTQLDWLDLGFDGRALGHLVLQSGRFFVGHRAGSDVSALTSRLTTPAIDGRTILSHLLARCMLDSFRIDAVGAPFEAKDALKARGYRWDPARRFWWREVEISDMADETSWLDEQVYRGRGQAKIQRVTPGERFATRA
jgi:DNA polymerase-3 subunit epsilon